MKLRKTDVRGFHNDADCWDDAMKLIKKDGEINLDE